MASLRVPSSWLVNSFAIAIFLLLLLISTITTKKILTIKETGSFSSKVDVRHLYVSISDRRSLI